MIRFIYRVIPIPIIYKDSLVKLAGKSYGVFIAIKESHRYNEALLQHELVHCRQFYRTLGLHGILTLVSKKYRLRAEVEAYKVTIEYKGYTEESEYEWIVDTLYTNYNLDTTKEEIRRQLNGNRK